MKSLVPDIFVRGGIDACFVEHLDTVCEAYAWCAAFGDLEVTGLRVLALDDLHPVSTALTKAIKYENQKAFGEVDYFFPRVVDFHFKVEPGELRNSQLMLEMRSVAVDLPLLDGERYCCFLL